jgi:hypothetical protein
MQMRKTKTWFDHALDDPRQAYGAPAQVLRDDRLDGAGMRALLSAWEADARRRTMAGAETPELRDVWAALAELDRIEAPIPS